MCEGLVLAVGDIVAVQATVAGALVYQPSAGVELIVTAIFAYNSVAHTSAGLIDASANQSFLAVQPAEAGSGHMNIKVGITNSVWLAMDGGGYKCGFSAVQTK